MTTRHRSTERLLLADDPGGKDRQCRHVEQAEADPDPGEVVRVVATEQATPRHGAHLVVQLRPADASAAVAEPDELDGVRIRRSRGGATWIHRWQPPSWSNGARRRHAPILGGMNHGPTARTGRSCARTSGFLGPPPATLSGSRPAVDANGRTRTADAGRGLVHDFVHQVIHTNAAFVRTPVLSVREPVQEPRRVSPRPGRAVQDPAMLGVEVEPLERVVGQQQAAVEVDPVRQRRDDRRSGDPDRRLLHAAEERLEAERPGAFEHPLRRADPAALGELDVDPGDDAHEAVEVLGQDAALVGDDAAATTAPGASGAGRAGRAGKGCSMSSTPRRSSSGRSPTASSGHPAGVGVDPDRTGVHGADRLERGEVLGSAALDLERREVGGAGGALRRRPSGSSMPIVKSVGGMSADRPRISCDRAAQSPCRRGRGARCRRRTGRRRARGSAASIARSAAARPDASGRPRRRRRAAAGRRPPSSRASRRRTGPGSPPRARRCPANRSSRSSTTTVVTRPVVRVVVGAGDPERVAQGEAQGLLGEVQAHRGSTQGSASTRSRIAAHSRSGPNRNGSSVGSPVSAAIAAMIRARLVVVRVERGVERDRDDLRRCDQPGDSARAGR